MRQVPVMQWRPPRHAQRGTGAQPRQRIQRDRMEGLAQATRTNALQRLTTQLRDDGGAEHSGESSLIRAKPKRGIAFGVFYLVEPLFHRGTQICDRDIVLEVHELALFGGARRRRAPERPQIRSRVALSVDGSTGTAEVPCEARGTLSSQLCLIADGR